MTNITTAAGDYDPPDDAWGTHGHAIAIDLHAKGDRHRKELLTVLFNHAHGERDEAGRELPAPALRGALVGCARRTLAGILEAKFGPARLREAGYFVAARAFGDGPGPGEGDRRDLTVEVDSGSDERAGDAGLRRAVERLTDRPETEMALASALSQVLVTWLAGIGAAGEGVDHSVWVVPPDAVA